MRYCDCGRELDKHCRLCSECAQVKRDYLMEINRFNYRNSAKGKEAIHQYENSEHRKELNRIVMRSESRKAYKREQYRKSKCRLN